jgi:hypothetical protein
MTTAIRRYLVGYIAKRRALALITAIGWAAAFAIGWSILLHVLLRWLPGNRWIDRPVIILGILACITIVARPILCLFRRYNPVAAAIEIEARRPDFDQRLITIASQPPESALLCQLVMDVEAITATKHSRPRVLLRPLLAPALALLVVALLCSTLHINPLEVMTRTINRPGK